MSEQNVWWSDVEYDAVRTQRDVAEARIAELEAALQAGRDLVWSAFSHVSHGGPTRKDAEEWIVKADAALNPQETGKGTL